MSVNLQDICLNALIAGWRDTYIATGKLQMYNKMGDNPTKTMMGMGTQGVSRL
jgi:hypothetical protein